MTLSPAQIQALRELRAVWPDTRIVIIGARNSRMIVKLPSVGSMMNWFTLSGGAMPGFIAACAENVWKNATAL